MPIERLFETEPATIARPRSEIALAIAKPLCVIGFKEREVGLTGRELIRRDLTTRILMDTVFGKSSELYQELDDAGLIDHTYGYDYEGSPAYSFAYVGGETEAPEQLISRLRDGVERVKRNGFSEQAFNRARTRKIGEFIRVFNSPEHLSYEFTQYLFQDADLYEVPAIMEGITAGLGMERLHELFDPAVMAVSLVTPSAAKEPAAA